MSYSAWSVSFAEQPSASKWNILGTNDAYFNSLLTGSGTIQSTVLTNPYKFSVYRTAAFNTNTVAAIGFDTRSFDTGSNVDIVTNKGRFTAPIAGFYHFESFLSTAQTSGIGYQLGIYKNGSLLKLGNAIISTQTTSFSLGIGVSGLVQLAANDYIEIFSVSGNTAVGVVGSTGCYFDGFLVSVT